MNALFAAFAAPPPAVTALAVGYSGGLDSTVLLHALRASNLSLPLRVIHVCHHLQIDAKAWARDCQQRCADWQVAFTRLDVVVADTADHGPEAAARNARYAALADALVPGEALVTAHHAEDQAETFLLQALRGAGVSGLAAMPALAALGAGLHWRPWLGVERCRLYDYARAHALPWIEDPSNSDPAMDRNYLRATVWPTLTARWPAAARTLARSAGHAAEAAAAVDRVAGRDLDNMRASPCGLSLRALGQLPRDRARAALRRWLASSGLDRPDHRHLAQILDLLDARLRRSPRVGFAGTEVRVFDGRLLAMPALARVPDAHLPWSGQQPLSLPDDCGEIRLRNPPVQPQALTVCFRRGGERLETGGGYHRPLKDVLRERRVAPWLRARVPLIYRGSTLLAAGPIWRHPRLDALLGTVDARLEWRHELPG